MNTRFALSGALAIASALLCAPASACPPQLRAEVVGHHNEVDARARDCADVSVYERGDGNIYSGSVRGYDSRAASAMIGNHGGTHVEIDGVGNRAGTIVRGHSLVRAGIVGNYNEIALRANNGAAISAQVDGDGNYVRGQAQ